MPTRNVVFTNRQHELIDSLVRSGRYQNASEVLCDGLRLLERRDAEDAARLEVLRDAVNSGIAAFERGAFRDFARPEALVAHLNAVAERAIAGSPRE